ncbi:MAG: putative quinol monooxygenase [Methyloligella sp. ZOD6]
MDQMAGVISFKAKPGKGIDVARALSAALPHVKEETGTSLWLILHSEVDPDTLFLVDLFRDSASRDAHMQGEAAKLIFDTVPTLLAEDPGIHPARLVTQKGL